MSANAQPELGAGSVIDRYEIVRHIARGGMGSVWLARFAGKHGFRKQVAIKTIAPEFASNAQFHAMFLEEARISSKLEHANVAQVLDVGEHDGGVYIVFEWVEGKSLEQMCRASEALGEPLPIPLLLRVIADACAGLHAAHELRDDEGNSLGIVHRDVTPGNVLVSDKGFAKVIDFGIAKSRDRVHGETRSGFVKGTPHYMSPEHACREPLDRRADVWSLGAVMFRAINGEPPFRDQTALLDYMDDSKPLAPLRAGTPPDVSAIVLRALQVDRSRRFDSAEEMRHAIERALHAAGTSSDEVSTAALRLASMEPSGDVVINVHAPTELAVPSVPPKEPQPTSEGKDVHASTLISPAARGSKPAPADSIKTLVITLVVAGVLALGAALLAFCG
jgi:serine/threonine-protein kinase